MGAVKHDDTVPIPSLKALDKLSTSELRNVYQDILNYPPPPRASGDFLKGNIAWAIQALERKKKPLALRQALIKTANGSASSKPRLSPGTRLVREWQGQTFEVTVLKQGYVWQGKTYRSLTDIATRITGTKWSGPRFFDLKKGVT